jgi:hypothetical protein
VVDTEERKRLERLEVLEVEAGRGVVFLMVLARGHLGKVILAVQAQPQILEAEEAAVQALLAVIPLEQL